MACIRQSHETSKVPFDFFGWIMLVISFAALILGLGFTGNMGLLNPVVLGLFCVFVIFLALFVHHTRNNENPVISLEVFGHKTHLLSLLFIFTIMLMGLSLGYLVPNFAQLVLDKPESVAGLMMIPGTTIMAIGSPLSGRLLDKFGAKRPMTVGAVMAIVGCGLNFALTPSLTTSTTVLFNILYSFCPALCMGNAIATGLSSLPDALKPDGNAANNTLQQLSAAIGTCIATSIVSQAQAAAPQDLAASTLVGAHRVFGVVFCAAIVLFLICIALFRRQGEHEGPAKEQAEA